MIMGKNVTIAIPVWNVEPYVEKCLTSVLGQDAARDGRICCLVVDDCGDDRSMDIVERLRKEHPQGKAIDIIRHDGNKGLGEARNTAIYNTDTDFLFFLDSDDYLPSTDAISMLLAAGEETSADITIGGCELTGNDRPIRTYSTYPSMTITTPHAGIYLTAYAAPRINTEAWGKLYKTSLFNDNNIQTMHPILEDIMLWMQTAYYADTVTTIKDVVYAYRRRPGSICTTGWRTPEKKAMACKVQSDLHEWCAHHPSLGMKPVRERMDRILEGKMR